MSTYTATATGFLALAVSRTGLEVSVTRCVLALLVSAVSHYWADRRTTLARLAALLGSADFYQLGQPRPGRDDNPSLGTGAYALDQSWHIAWLFIAALIIA